MSPLSVRCFFSALLLRAVCHHPAALPKPWQSICLSIQPMAVVHPSLTHLAIRNLKRISPKGE